MTYFVEGRWGGSEQSPAVERMREILAELDVDDQARERVLALWQLLATARLDELEREPWQSGNGMIR